MAYFLFFEKLETAKPRPKKRCRFRRAHERDLLAHYQQALAAGGVEGYGGEECWNDYRINAIYGLQVGFLAWVR